MKNSSAAGRAIHYVLLAICTLIFLSPLYLALINSLNSWYSSPVLMPEKWEWNNFYYATILIEFWKYLGNSIILAIITVGLSTVSSGMAGYAFARLRVPGNSVMFIIVLATMMLPGIVTQIPTYILFNKMHLINTFWPWVFWGIGGNAFFIFMYRQFFLTIPAELEEAARIDGCSFLRIYWSIILPSSKPVVATVAILTFQGSWNDVTGPFMFLTQEKYPLATALSMIGYLANGSTQVITQVSLAGGLLLAIPIIITFFIGQRQIVEGIVTTGVKG